MKRYRLMLLIGLGWLLVSAAAGAGEYRLWLEVPGGTTGQPVSAELGRALTVQLWYRGPADLDRIVTTPWQHDFAVDQGYAVRDNDDQRLRLRLIPRRSGQLSLPPLRLGGAQSEALPVRIGPAMEAGEALQPHWSLSESQPWQRQELLAELWLDLATTQARLELGKFQPTGFAVQALPVTQTTQPDGRHRTHYRWLLRPQQAGPQALTAPVLNYVRDGVPLRRFHFPDTLLTVQPLPAYVPPTVPVGCIYPGDAPGAALFADGIDAATLAATLQRAGLPATAAQRSDPAQGTLSEARIDWSRATPNPAGVVYFDPRAGRLQTLRPEPPGLAWQATGWLLLAAALLGGIWQRRALARRLDRWRYRRALRASLSRAMDAEALADTLLGTPLPGAETPAATLRIWVSAYSGLFGLEASRTRALSALLARLEQARFGAGEWPPHGAAQLRALL